MMSLLDSTTARVPRTRFVLNLWRGAALTGVLCASIAGCTGNEVPKAPEAAAPEPAEAAPATPTASTGSAGGEPAPHEAALHEAANNAGAASAVSIYPLTMKRLDGSETSLAAWSGKVLLIVNTASKCGYTPQYQGLQQLHTKYSKRGFEVLGFPSNDFGGQEPGTAEEISKFCISIYDVNFPMFEKTKVIGQEQSPLYALLSGAHGEPKWNFHKYLIDKHGQPVQAWPSKVEPGSPEIASAIEAQLAAD